MDGIDSSPYYNKFFGVDVGPIFKSIPNYKAVTSDVFCTDVLDHILSCVPDKNNYGYNRKESIELWSRMAPV